MAPSPESYRRRSGAGGSRLAGLDGLRALAAFSVLVYHVSVSCGWTRHGALAPVMAEFKAGVGVFFVISGCVLWLPWARALSGGGELPDLRRYASRRARRILPAYWLALSVLLLLPSGPVLGTDTLRYYGLAQIYNADTVLGGLGNAWSMCVEVSFYLALVVLAIVLASLLTRRRSCVGARAQLAVLSVIAAGSLGWRAALVGSPLAAVPHNGFLIMTALPGFADWFALGMALAVGVTALEAGATVPRALSWALDRPRWCWAAAWGLMALAAAAQTTDLFLALYGPVVHLLVGLAALVMVGTAVLTSATPRRRLPAGGWLRWAPCRWLGTVSYGVYLWHMIVLEAVLGTSPRAPAHAQSPVRWLGLLVAVSAGSVVCAAVSWYAIERPLLHERSRASVVAAPGAA
jgi:peptidoglycan/LPS O-acetylase OafA/YrhL